jgi:TolA-binding protein
MHKSIIVGILLAGASLPVAASAQSNVEGRVGKLESEMRAVQRKVFPGGAGKLLQPEVTGPQTTAGPGPGTPATSAVADLAQRVTSLEQQIASMTGQVEQTEYKIRQLQEQFDAYRRATDDRMKLFVRAVEGTGGPDEDAGPPARPSGATAAARPANAVEKPSTGNPAEDEYLYGYRLWAAKSYAEAQTQLKKVVATYPKDRRASYAQNLLGRAYLDEGKPSLASMAFYDNYKKMPDGERASESLYYLGQSLTKLNKSADACKVYDELNDVYGAKLSRDMTAKVAAGRAAAKCK